MYTYAPYYDDFDEEERTLNTQSQIQSKISYNEREYHNLHDTITNCDSDEDEVKIQFYDTNTNIQTSLELTANPHHHSHPRPQPQPQPQPQPEIDIFNEIQMNISEEHIFESYFRINHQEDYDNFFEGVYDYYYKGGWIPWIAGIIFDLIISIIAGCISILVLRCIDWGSLLECTGTEPNDCRNMSKFINFRWISNPETSYDTFILMYFGILCMYYIWIIALVPGKLFFVKKMRILYESFLNIQYEDLRVITWEDIVNSLIKLEEERGVNLQLQDGNELQHETWKNETEHETEHEDVMKSLNVSSSISRNADEILRLRLTRFNNLWKHLLREVLGNIQWSFRIPLSIRAFFSKHLRNAGDSPIGDNDYRLINDTPENEYWNITIKIPFTSTMDYTVKTIIRNLVFTNNKTITPSFTPVNLRVAMILYGCFLLVCLPFMTLYVCVFWILTIIEQSKNSKYIVGKPYWSYESRWASYKEYELPHEQQTRLSKAMDIWEEYSGLFRRPIYSLIRQSLGYIGGSILAVLVVISVLVDESVLLTTELWGRPLYWYIVILTGSVVAIRGEQEEPVRKFITPETKNIFCEKIREIVEKLEWDLGDDRSLIDTREHTLQIKQQIGSQIMSEPVRIVWDIFTMICMPGLLFFYFPTKATDIVLETKKRIKEDPVYGAYI